MNSPSVPRQGAKHFLSNALAELGLTTIWQSSRDVKLLCAQRFVRLFAYGGSTLILASYLSALGITDDRIGLFMTLTLVGDVIISFFLTLFADAMGRRAVLTLGSALMAASGVVFAISGNFWTLLAAAIFGVISPRCVYFSDSSVRTLAQMFVAETKSGLFVRSRNQLLLISHRVNCSAMYLCGIPSLGMLARL